MSNSLNIQNHGEHLVVQQYTRICFFIPPDIQCFQNWRNFQQKEEKYSYLGNIFNNEHIAPQIQMGLILDEIGKKMYFSEDQIIMTLNQ